MFHKATPTTRAYYDTIGEMPATAQLYFPLSRDFSEMTAEQMVKLSDDGWCAIIHSCDYGVCDHWYAIPLATWAGDYFGQIIRLTDDDDKTVGYNRRAWSVRLTRDRKYQASRVWNS